MSDATSQLLVAAHDAEIHPSTRTRTQISPEEFQAWRGEMEAVGANDETFQILTNPERKAGASDDEKCRVLLQMMKGALRLPKAVSAKVALNILG